ncbi:MAG: hypothetical protein RLZZ508_829 [Actinomycetota bacterium]
MSDDLSWREIILRGHRTIPRTSWRSERRWHPNFKTFVVLILGLSIFGFGEALLVITGLGNSPWVVLSQGITLRTGLDIGVTTFAVSVVVLLLWIPLKEKPGLGTLCNIVVIAAALDVSIKFLPKVETLQVGIPVTIAGVLFVGLGSSLYLTCNLGPGPRDGLMTSLHNKTGVRVSRVRFSLEIVVLSIGYLLGGTLGLGTLLFAAGIGRAIALWLGVVSVLAKPK